ncbi:hypothetical protein ALC60_13459 [Trachymyrmex zeteki]|uniref:Double jelly roll-like domain-containing protein n=1 Tax=Mycetomoellerius zeteki TaxID=64791 RepID=A0A151WI58_9HYME|nr:hypothetical protein ALC60_13459 [Trachymyrmex zeteki]
MTDILNIASEAIFDDRIVKIETHTYNPYANTTMIMSQDASLFDDYNLSNVKLYLNSEFYPYDDLNLDFGKRRYAVFFLTHYIFSCPMPWNFLTTSDKSCASWLSAYHHGLRWDDGIIPYSMTKHLIKEAVIEEDEALVCVKELEKWRWLADILDSDDVIVETLDAHYEDVESLRNLDDCNTIRCGRHANNCSLQNVFKIFNWWSRRQKEL